MTLIASFVLEGVPILMADALLTFEEGVESPVLELPTIGLVSELPPGRRRIRGLIQKIEIITPTFVLAFAGDTVQGETIFKQLRKRALQKELTLADVQAFATSRGELFSRSAYVGYFLERIDSNQGRLHRLNWGARNFDGGYLGNVSVAGTGSSLPEVACAENQIGPSGYESLEPQLATICKVLSLCGLLLQREMIDKRSIRSLATGGIYEVVFLNGAQFEKAEVTYVTWYVDARKKRVNAYGPKSIINVKYFDQVLVVNSAILEKVISDKDDSQWNCAVHAIYPIGVSQVNSKIPPKEDMNFESLITVNLIAIETAGDPILNSEVEIGRSRLRPAIRDDIFFIPDHAKLISALEEFSSKVVAAKSI